MSANRTAATSRNQCSKDPVKAQFKKWEAQENRLHQAKSEKITRVIVRAGTL